MSYSEIIKYVKSQKSLHLYEHIQEVLVEILSNVSSGQFDKIKNNLIIMAFHENISGQVMHFEPRNDKFAVMQLYVPSDMPKDVLRWVIAHELGHVMQGRNWKDSDDMKLEDDATDFAEKIGFVKTESITNWLSAES